MRQNKRETATSASTHTAARQGRGLPYAGHGLQRAKQAAEVAEEGVQQGATVGCAQLRAKDCRDADCGPSGRHRRQRERAAAPLGPVQRPPAAGEGCIVYEGIREVHGPGRRPSASDAACSFVIKAD